MSNISGDGLPVPSLRHDRVQAISEILGGFKSIELHPAENEQ